MSVRRKDDAESRSWYRSHRLFQQDSEWYFATREGSVEGPFGDLPRAQDKLAAYVRALCSPVALFSRAGLRDAAPPVPRPVSRLHCEHDKRNRKAAVPRSLGNILSETQLQGLKTIEGLGWRVAFVRRPLFQQATVALVSADGAQLGVLDAAGNVRLESGLSTRR